jgi:hypothetical protein
MRLSREGSNLQRKECKAAINENTPFSGYPCGWLKLFLPGCAHVCNEPRVSSQAVLVIASSVAEAEVAIDGSADHVCIAVILPIVLPPADLAQLQSLGHG